MPEDFSEAFEEKYSKATFNEAFLQMRRINDMQSTINNIRSVPLHYNSDLNNYNYVIIFSNLCSLLFEAWGKMTEKERKEADELRKVIQKFIRVNIPHRVTQDLAKNSTKVVVDYNIWYQLEDLLTEFEKSIRVYMDKHGLTNPTDEGAGLF